MAVFPLSADGGIEDRCQHVLSSGAASNPARRLVLTDPGRGISFEVNLPGAGEEIPAAVNFERQESAHAHAIQFAPGGRLALSADLGMDRVWVFRFNEGRLTIQRDANGMGTFTGANLTPGAGPRHMAFHPNGRFLYVSTELASTAVVFAWNDETGEMKPVQEVSLLPADYQAHNDAAHIALTPDGRFLYASNRGHNSLAMFAVDGESGCLTALGHVATQGNWPRNFCIDPDGKFLLVANQESACVVVFAIDDQSGALTPTGESIQAPTPYFVMVVDL
jgi:6-phosphogluconolactonase